MNMYWSRISVLASLLMTGCQMPAAMIATGAGAMPAYELPPRPQYDVPAQVIYAIDKDRYFTLENYRECGGSQVYYNDTKSQIRTLVEGAISSFPGRLFLDGTPKVLVFPDSISDGTGYCGVGERGCFLSIYYSLDGGRTFDWFHPWRLGGDRKRAYEIAKNLTVTLKGTELFVGDEFRAVEYTFRNGTKGESSVVEGGPTGVPRVRTPSGQERITCDDSIRPKGIIK